MKLQEILRLVLLNYKKIFLLTITGTVVFTVLLYLFYPLTFTSTCVLLPPEQKTGSSLSGLLAMGGGDLNNLIPGAGKTNSQLYAEILKSRTVALEVVGKYNLAEFYGSDDTLDAATELRKNLIIEVTKESILKVSVALSTGPGGRISSEKDSVKKLAAIVTNGFIAALDRVNREKLSSTAKKARIYLEGQLGKTKLSLDSAESALAVFQKESKAISLPEQLNAAIETAAQLKGEIISTQINLGYLSQNLSSDNQMILSLQKKLQALEQQYSKIENTNKDFLLNFSSAPELALKLADLTRSVKILNQVYVLLQQQYFQEKLQENKDIQTVDVLDEAIPEKKPSSPRTLFSALMVFVTLFLIVLFGLMRKQKQLSEFPKIG